VIAAESDHYMDKTDWNTAIATIETFQAGCAPAERIIRQKARRQLKNKWTNLGIRSSDYPRSDGIQALRAYLTDFPFRAGVRSARRRWLKPATTCSIMESSETEMRENG
jgi:hypothetical protein